MSSVNSVLRMQTFFYERNADGRIIFENGLAINVNKAILAFISPFFDKEFFGRPPKNEYRELEFDYSTVKLFLDCLLGFDSYDPSNSCLIFPVAKKYKVEDSLKKCIKALKPVQMNEIVCRTLNLALCHDCKELIDDVINFFKKDFNIISLLETEQLNSVLLPISMAKLVEIITLDSDIVKIICKWAETYLKNNRSSLSISLFLKNNQILGNLCFEFESFQSIFNIQDAEETKGLFTIKKITSFLKEKLLLNTPRKFPNSSSWFLIRSGQKLTENFSFLKQSHLSNNNLNNGKVILQIWRNQINLVWKASLETKNDVCCSLSCAYVYWDIGQNGEVEQNAINVNDINNHQIIAQNGKTFYEIEVPVTADFFSISNIIITYTFNCDCKILKTSADDSFTDNDPTLYFTYAISKKP